MQLPAQCLLDPLGNEYVSGVDYPSLHSRGDAHGARSHLGLASIHSGITTFVHRRDRVTMSNNNDNHQR